MSENNGASLAHRQNGVHAPQPPAPRPSRPRRKRGLHALAARAIDDVLDDNARLRAELVEFQRLAQDWFSVSCTFQNNILKEIRELRKFIEREFRRAKGKKRTKREA